MKINFLALLLASVFLPLSFCSCGGEDATPDYEFPDGPEPEPKPEPSKDYPEGLTVTPFTETFQDGKQCLGFVAIADLKANPKLRFNAVYLSEVKTPTAIHSDFAVPGRGKAYLTINGGYWWAGVSLSLLITDGVQKSVENQVVTRKNAAGSDVDVYAVRSAFGMMSSGSFESQWIYCMSGDGNKPYSFPSPLGNDERTKVFLPSPPNTTTQGGALWAPNEAIGGGPMLVKSSKNVAVDSYWREAFDGGGIGGTSRQPRTAIGATADGKVILIVCDGRNMRGSAGFTLEELADKLIALGAVMAINLDGGGSSTMVGHDGEILNRPSDSADGQIIKQRRITTAVVLSAVN